MSLSTVKTQNPAKKFIEWSSSRSFSYYDKVAKENVPLELPFYIVPLDILATIKGFHESSMSSVYSNEVHSTKSEPLDVKSFKGGNIVSGLYNDIKGSLEGGKFSNSIYAVMVTGTKANREMELVNVNLSGAALGAFIDAKIKTDGGIIEVNKDPELKKKGAVKYYVPMFKKHAADKSILEDCVGIDTDLQAYLSTKKQAPKEEMDVKSTPPSNESISSGAVTTADKDESGTDDLPF